MHGTEFGFHNPANQLPASSSKRRYKFTLGNQELEAAHIYELLELEDDVEVFGRWSSRFASERPMITSRKVGHGHAVYVGTYLTAPLVESLSQHLLARAGIEPLVPDLPPNVEVTMRAAGDRKLLFIMNCEEAAVQIKSVPSGMDLISGERNGAMLELAPYGCAVILH